MFGIQRELRWSRKARSCRALSRRFLSRRNTGCASPNVRFDAWVALLSIATASTTSSRDRRGSIQATQLVGMSWWVSGAAHAAQLVRNFIISPRSSAIPLRVRAAQKKGWENPSLAITMPNTVTEKYYSSQFIQVTEVCYYGATKRIVSSAAAGSSLSSASSILVISAFCPMR